MGEGDIRVGGGPCGRSGKLETIKTHRTQRVLKEELTSAAPICEMSQARSSNSAAEASAGNVIPFRAARGTGIGSWSCPSKAEQWEPGDGTQCGERVIRVVLFRT